MIDRRFFVAGALAMTVAALPALAQHQDLGVAEEPGDTPPTRRWMMEDTYGNVVTDEDMLGKFTLIYFGYTGCPDVCPTTLSVIAEAMEALGARADMVVPLFVTVDPEHDTALLMREYTGFMHPAIVGLRGPKAYTDHMVAAFNARYEVHVPDPAYPDRYSIDHTASVALVGPDGLLIKRYPHGTTADEMAADLGAILDTVPQ
ncbi:MAG: SCO family protein [Maritimibacter sp.]|nr:SCO family protein [Maritimibacter sp.]